LGLVSAIRKEAKDLIKTAGVRARVNISDNFGRIDPVIETAIYRVVQESLHNVAKHAQASSVEINMERRGEMLTLTIEDDGTGIRRKASPSRTSFGLAGMHERISSMGGHMKVESRDGEGTKIAINVPLPAGRTPKAGRQSAAADDAAKEPAVAKEAKPRQQKKREKRVLTGTGT
jgi:signal transduction histidine kinase